MTSVAQVIKNVCPKLVPFFKTLAIYFVVFIPCNQPSVLATVLKCLPILALVVFIILHTRSLGSEYKFSKKIITGMLFGCLGDALLIWPGYFDAGAFSFLIGHLFYIHAFGFKPLKLLVGIICYAVAILGTLMVFFNDLHGILVIGAPLYSIVLMTMVWRAIARVQYTANPWTLSKVCTCLGAISFAVSDFFVGINYFQGGFEYDQLVIMITYYAAQFGIALSVLDIKMEQSFNEKIQQSQTTIDSRKED